MLTAFFSFYRNILEKLAADLKQWQVLHFFFMLAFLLLLFGQNLEKMKKLKVLGENIN